MQQLRLEFVLAAEFVKDGVDVGEDGGVDFGAGHVRDGADGEFAGDAGGDDGFGARGGEAALDAVEGEGGVAPAGHEGGFFGRVDVGAAAHGLVQVVHRIGYVRIDLTLGVCDGGDHFGDARDEDGAVRVDEGGEDADEVRHGLLGGAAEDPRVQILRGAGDGHGVVVAAAQAEGQAGFFGAEPVVVGDAAGVGGGEEATGEGFTLDEGVEALGAVFFHAFEAHQEVDGEGDVGGLVGLQRVQPAEDGAFVVGGAAAVHAVLGVDG